MGRDRTDEMNGTMSQAEGMVRASTLNFDEPLGRKVTPEPSRYKDAKSKPTATPPADVLKKHYNDKAPKH